MEELNRINQVEQLIVDSSSLMKLIDEMYYKKKFNEIEKYVYIAESDKKFRECRTLLVDNLDKLKKKLNLNYNLVIALQIHLQVITNEIENLDLEDDKEDDKEDITMV